MNLKNVLWVRNTGKILPSASIQENLFGLKLSGGGTEEKTIDFTPVISISDAKAGNALDYQFKITAVQSGTPSPDNICPITGFTGANIGHANGAVTIENGEIVIPFSQSGTGNPTPTNIRPISAGLTIEMDDSTTLAVYDGALNPLSGELTIKRKVLPLGTSSDWEYISNVFHRAVDLNSYDPNFYLRTDRYTPATSVRQPSTAYNRGNYTTCWRTNPYDGFYVRDDRYDNVADFLEGNAGAYFVYAPAEPDTIQLSPTELQRAMTALGVEIIPVSWQSEAGTIFMGIGKITEGKIVKTWEEIASYNGETLPGLWLSDRDVYAPGTTPTIGAQVIYELETPITYTLTPTEITLAEGSNTLWSDTGDSSMTYLAKR